MPKKKDKQTLVNQIEELNNSTSSPVFFETMDFKYHSTHQTLNWKCKDDHVWLAPITRILRGHKCPICSSAKVGKKNSKSVEKFLHLLQQRNEKYPDIPVSIKDINEYHGITKKMTWMCKDGHEWKAVPKTVIHRGTYCPECRRLSNIQRQSDTHQTVLKKLEDRNKLNPSKRVYIHPSDYYTNGQTKILFMCDDGHTWKGAIGDVLNCNSGCPVCAKGGYSNKAIDWLTQIMEQQNISIQHIKNGGEYKIPGTKYRVDGFCKETNTIYEFYGDFWHGNPNTTDSNDINSITKTTFGQLYHKTKQREQNIKKQGYNIKIIWESEWDTNNSIVNDFKQIVKSKCFVKDFVNYDDNIIDIIPLTIYLPTENLGILFCQFDRFTQQITQDSRFNDKIQNIAQEKNIKLFQIYEDEWLANNDLIIEKIKHYAHRSTSQQIYARHCCIRKITPHQKGEFLNSNHIQGNDKSTIHLGGFWNDTLVAVMTFSPPRIAVGGRMDSKGIELVRFATDMKFHVIGIASKLLKHFERTYQPTSVYSFADRRWSTGNLYYQLGFELQSTNPPDYFYVIDNKRKHRWNYRKDIIKHALLNYDSELTEYQNMLNHGYDRVWGCGTLKFIKEYI